MTMAEFEASLADGQRPPGLSPALDALWWDAAGDWARAHAAAAADEASAEAASVHAYLHRREGDNSNARYWYARARRPVATGPLDVERHALIAELLGWRG